MNHQHLINTCEIEQFQGLLFSDLSGPLKASHSQNNCLAKSDLASSPVPKKCSANVDSSVCAYFRYSGESLAGIIMGSNTKKQKLLVVNL